MSRKWNALWSRWSSLWGDPPRDKPPKQKEEFVVLSGEELRRHISDYVDAQGNVRQMPPPWKRRL